jgi:hypothetical protein
VIRARARSRYSELFESRADCDLLPIEEVKKKERSTGDGGYVHICITEEERGSLAKPSLISRRFLGKMSAKMRRAIHLAKRYSARVAFDDELSMTRTKIKVP